MPKIFSEPATFTEDDRDSEGKASVTRPSERNNGESGFRAWRRIRGNRRSGLQVLPGWYDTCER